MLKKNVPFQCTLWVGCIVLLSGCGTDQMYASIPLTDSSALTAGTGDGGSNGQQSGVIKCTISDDEKNAENGGESGTGGNGDDENQDSDKGAGPGAGGDEDHDSDGGAG